MGCITRVTLATLAIATLIVQQTMGAPQQACQGELMGLISWWIIQLIDDVLGIDVLYPKDGSSFSRSEQETVYLILGKYQKIY